MKRRIFGIAIFYLISLVGCTVNLVGQRPYREFIGKDITLKRPVKLYERKFSNITLWHGEVPLKPGELFQMVTASQTSEEEDRKIVADGAFAAPITLPAGTPLRIKKIYSWMNGSGQVTIRAEGRVFAPPYGRDVRFEFCWGDNDVDQRINMEEGKIVRAPWEDEVVPETRTVRYNGTGWKP